MITFEAAVKSQPTYEPQEQFKKELLDTSVTAIVGATAVGKNFLIERCGLPQVGRVTTRQPRKSDFSGRYTYLTHAEMLSHVEARDLVQYAVVGSDIYGSTLDDYELGKANLADVAYDAVSNLENKGFTSVRSVSVLTGGKQWAEQLTTRLEGMMIHTVIARLAEAKHSLRWTRAQVLGGRATHHLVIINNRDNPSENARRINTFANGQAVDSPDTDVVVRYIEEMEKTIQIFQGRMTT